ncbi:hypothetical protein [Sinomonas sp. P47F7]|uniref:hypothetical protein n=1 Tax=Sinomonas sp. P47F7 TaxID=3410987 RepID=UPI003BF473CC
MDEDRIDVVSPGVDLDIFRPAFRSRARVASGVPAASFHVLFAGRLQRLKGRRCSSRRPASCTAVVRTFRSW